MNSALPFKGFSRLSPRCRVNIIGLYSALVFVLIFAIVFWRDFTWVPIICSSAVVAGLVISSIFMSIEDQTPYPLQFEFTTILNQNEKIHIGLVIKMAAGYFTPNYTTPCDIAAQAAINRYFSTLAQEPTYDELENVLENSLAGEIKELGIPYFKIRVKSIENLSQKSKSSSRSIIISDDE